MRHLGGNYYVGAVYSHDSGTDCGCNGHCGRCGGRLPEVLTPEQAALARAKLLHLRLQIAKIRLEARAAGLT